MIQQWEPPLKGMVGIIFSDGSRFSGVAPRGSCPVLSWHPKCLPGSFCKRYVTADVRAYPCTASVLCAELKFACKFDQPILTDHHDKGGSISSNF